jgi:hypothetical protein
MLSALSEAEKQVVRRSIEVAFLVLGEIDCHTRLGVTPLEISELLSTWPLVDDSRDSSPACLAINNSLNELLHGVGISEAEAQNSIGASPREMARIYKKWAAARGWRLTGLR